MGTLTGRTAIVTGGGGIAAAASDALSRAGASVVLAARDRQAVEALADLIGGCGGQVIAVAADLSTPVSVRRLIDQTLGAFGRLDAAFNDTGPRDLSLALRYQIPSMRGGRIVNLASSAAARRLTRAAARHAAGSGVRINAVAGDHPQRIADAVVWLCADAVALGNGETLVLRPEHGVTPDC